MKKRGFTLVELMIVIGIICLLISIILPQLQRRSNNQLPVTEISPNVWVFDENSRNNLIEDLQTFLRQHSDLEMVGSPSPVEWGTYHHPTKYIVNVKKKEAQ